jgi:hypothetical protein
MTKTARTSGIYSKYQIGAKKQSDVQKTLSRYFFSEMEDWVSDNKGRVVEEKEIAQAIIDADQNVTKTDFQGRIEDFLIGPDTVADFKNTASKAEIATAIIAMDEAAPHQIDGARQVYRDAGILNPTDTQLEEYMAADLLNDVPRKNKLLGRAPVTPSPLRAVTPPPRVLPAKPPVTPPGPPAPAAPPAAAPVDPDASAALQAKIEEEITGIEPGGEAEALERIMKTVQDLVGIEAPLPEVPPFDPRSFLSEEEQERLRLEEEFLKDKGEPLIDLSAYDLGGDFKDGGAYIGGELGTEVVGKTDKGRDVYMNPNGTISSERTVTTKLPDDTYMNVPTIFKGKEVSEDEALEIIQDPPGSRARAGIRGS